MAGITQVLSQSENFPKVPGDQPWSVVDVAGPSSYTAITPADPIVTGGQQLAQSVFGLNTNIVFACSMGSDNGQYTVNVYHKTFVPGQPTTGGLVLQWIVAATGAEASGDLSARTVRLLVIGRN
jgi:hypothetical protein